MRKPRSFFATPSTERTVPCPLPLISGQAYDCFKQKSIAEDSREFLRRGHRQPCSFCLALLKHWLLGSTLSGSFSEHCHTLGGSPSHMQRPRVGTSVYSPSWWVPSLWVIPIQRPNTPVKKLPNESVPQIFVSFQMRLQAMTSHQPRSAMFKSPIQGISEFNRFHW